MKKNYLYSALFAAALTLGFTSCSSNDDEENVIGEEDVIKTQDDVYALINGAYRPYQTLSSTFTSTLSGIVNMSHLKGTDGSPAISFWVKPGIYQS